MTRAIEVKVASDVLRTVLEDAGLSLEKTGSVFRFFKSSNTPTNVGMGADLALGMAIVKRLRAKGKRDRSKSKASVGASMKFCGHEAVFPADVFDFSGVVVVIAPSPIKAPREGIDEPGCLSYDKIDVMGATHHVTDFPVRGYWNPERGILVVPRAQLTDLTKKERKCKSP